MLCSRSVSVGFGPGFVALQKFSIFYPVKHKPSVTFLNQDLSNVAKNKKSFFRSVLVLDLQSLQLYFYFYLLPFLGEAAIFVPVLLFLPQDESVVPAVGRHVETVGRREQLSAWLTATVAEAANRDVISARYW